ncbi:hypothetical protein FACS1894155_10170 [Bacteroidia bacterium]|nr:hypothetical protein FACS1894155_10170 [Bacteroidia bacterium]
MKKLTLKKEIVSNLDGNEMNQIKGGGIIESIFLMCPTGVGVPCPGEESEEEEEPESEYYGSCEDTCGSKYTCNGIV